MQTLAEAVQPSKKLLDENEAAQYLSIAPGTLCVWRCTGRYGIPFMKVGRRVRYRQTDLDKWLESRTHLPDAA